MRNFIFLALVTSILFISGCSKSESGSGSAFSHPSWIQGSWVETSDFFGDSVDNGMKFTSDGVYYIILSGLIDYNYGYNSSAVELINTESKYSYQLTGNDGQDVITTCVPGSELNEIECIATGEETTVFTYSDAY